MRKLLLLLQIILFGLTSKAQDTLWVKKADGKAFVIHKVKSGEDIFLLSKKYKVPPAALADANNLNYQGGLASGTIVWVPVDNYNFIRIESVVKSKPIYYKVGRNEALKDVTRMINVAQSTLQMWNHMSEQDIFPGQVLQIGWIAFDDTQVPFSATSGNSDVSGLTQKQKGVIGYPGPKPQATVVDSVKTKAGLNESSANEENDTIASPYEQLYETQTMGNASNNESGAAVFYPLKMKMAEGIYYAFHNTAAKGTIIKVMNPANGNFIYAKVIGTIPKLGDYNNCIIALSTNAAKGLMAKERRMFCKIEYQ
ncbi:LysM peptidoglycan-binding domain-containing protein [Taibaiella lutea]|uniref:LysM peptidoglycan-binding domain-containing protein n=1 Tax=Taibaiella lutea TaxID=2608001 RepID=A0A5M6CE21_9BACT|nr:LysM peptidoglycan-binding domain-containing protein [Taibaiella lutea]KAA5533341.1 LysM peptidoglycan-binding domain-containing protein [Taibaiella lutea]